MPSIFLACKESYVIARFNKEKDKVIVVESGLNRGPSRVSHVPGYRPCPIYWKEEAFKAFASAKHIASFVTAEMKCDIPDMQHTARRFYESAQSKFPQMETFTTISINGIRPMAWAYFTDVWQLQAKRDARTEGTSPPRLVVPLQDQSLRDSWVVLDRKKRHLELKKSWEAEEDRLEILGQGELERVTRAQAARKNCQAERRRSCRISFLVARLGSELGKAEESIEWELEANWWVGRGRESQGRFSQ
jgi:hypothetical protein